MSEQVETPVEDRVKFVASMELYEHADGIHAIIRVQGSENSEEVLVPPHMAAMLPQAIAMLQQQAEENAG